MCAEIQRANQDAVGRAPSGGFILVNTEASLRSTLTSAGQWKLLIKASGCSYGTADCQGSELGIKHKVKTNTEDLLSHSTPRISHSLQQGTVTIKSCSSQDDKVTHFL